MCDERRGPGGDMPGWLAPLARQVVGKGYEAAKRLVVSRVGSVGRGERFGDDVADAVFLRLQRNAQVGRYADEAGLAALGRNARRLEGEGDVVLFRAAPRGAGIRPGDFASDDRSEAANYLHGGHVMHRGVFPRADVVLLDGSVGGGREYVLLPRGYVPPEPAVAFGDFRSFWEAANGPAPSPVPEADGAEPDPPAFGPR